MGSTLNLSLRACENLQPVAVRRNGRQKRRIALATVAVFASVCCTARELPAGQSTFAEVEFFEPPTVREVASEVFDSPEFRNLPRLDLGPNAVKAKPEPPKKAAKPQAVQPKSSSAGGTLVANLFGSAISVVVVAVLALLLAAIIALIVLGVRRWERAEKPERRTDADATTDDDPEPMITPSEKPADAWLAAARAAAAAARFDEALALLLLGTMSHAERAGLIRPRRGLTYRDYLRAVPRDSAWHSVLAGLIRTYAPVGFGRRDANRESFETAVEPYEHALRVEPTPVKAVALIEGTTV